MAKALAQNPSIKNALEMLEERLRGAGVLPLLNEAIPLIRQEPPMRDRDAKQRRQDGQRLNSLEQENAALRAELAQAKVSTARFLLGVISPNFN